jgi:hypothetical protein
MDPNFSLESKDEKSLTALSHKRKTMETPFVEEEPDLVQRIFADYERRELHRNSITQEDTNQFVNLTNTLKVTTLTGYATKY